MAVGHADVWNWVACRPPFDAVAEHYLRRAGSLTDVERQVEVAPEDGVFTGADATNPATKQSIPVFVADYVLMGYGTGAIMAVPGQDERDWDFAEVYELPILRTVEPPADADRQAYVGEGPRSTAASSTAPRRRGRGQGQDHRWLDAERLGEGTVAFRLRDWLFCRQRYWGEPFPISTTTTAAVVRPRAELPVALPEIDDFRPRHVATTRDPHRPSRRWHGRTTGSRSCSSGDGPRTYRREIEHHAAVGGLVLVLAALPRPAQRGRVRRPAVERYWMGPQRQRRSAGGVDLYVGGAEHAVLHLLYARFWHKVLYDLGPRRHPEPFDRLFNQGYMLAAAYQRRPRHLRRTRPTSRSATTVATTRDARGEARMGRWARA